MGMLEELNRRLDLGIPEKGSEGEIREMHVQAITASLLEIAEGLPKATEVDLNGVERAIQALTKAMNVNVEAPVVTVEPKIEVEGPNVTVEAPKVTVEAPNVEVLMPDHEAMEFEIRRDRNGLMTSVIARPYKPTEVKDDFTLS